MKAVQISECGGTEVLQLAEVPVPARKPGQVQPFARLPLWICAALAAIWSREPVLYCC